MFISKKSTRSRLICDCDTIFRDIIRKRDVCCQKTSKITKLQVCHFFSRSMLNLRWEEDNVCLLNGGIHRFWAHQHPEAFRDWWMERIGAEKFFALKLKSRYVSTIFTSDLKVMKEALKKRLKELEPPA